MEQYLRVEDDNPIVKRARREIKVGSLEIGLIRTCRVPYDRENDLPAGLGSFPIYKVEDFSDTAPKDWDKKDYFMPMYQCEAMWMNFQRYMFNDGPSAVIVGSGAINAVTGKKIRKYRLEEKQNYLAVPPQPWIDGWKDNDGKVYQFVASDLGKGETVEGQITGKEKVGGIQLAVFKPKPDADITPASRPREYVIAGGWPPVVSAELFGSSKLFDIDHHLVSRRAILSRSDESPVMLSVMSVRSMGLGRGGQIRQKIYPDPYGLKVWQEEPSEMVTVHILNSEDFRTVTGYNPPATPINYKTYQMYGYPWFELWDKELKDTQGSGVFSKLKPVSVEVNNSS